MVVFYPTVFTKLEDGYMVYIPDLQCNTQGDTLAEAFEMARDVIGMMCMDMEDDGKAIPAASDPTAIQTKAQEFLSVLDVDIDAYRRKHNQRSVRRNVSLPCWLNELADQAGLNVSSILQTALKQELHIL